MRPPENPWFFRQPTGQARPGQASELTGSVAAPTLADRISRKRVLIVAIALFAGGAILTGCWLNAPCWLSRALSRGWESAGRNLL